MSYAQPRRHPKEVLISARKIQRRVKYLAHKISRDYANKEVLLVSVLKGSVIFLADLLRHLEINCAVDFISVSSYKGTESTGVVQLLNDLRENPVGKHLLLVEDIVDSGYTLAYLRRNLLTRKCASLRTCVLLDKEESRKTPVPVEYRGFAIPDAFVVGYGLDYQEEYRGLPYIAVLGKPGEGPSSAGRASRQRNSKRKGKKIK
ncbi:MAG: hypoxanthine phosphoribosyltransferase [Endomicrobiales bacterium]